MNWQILHSSQPTKLADTRSILLKNRKIAKRDEKEFFHPIHPLEISLESVGIDVSQMKKAVQRIDVARREKHDVVVFGDYDADGVSATAILWETLYEMGVKARPFIPNREKHGYGISHRSLDDLLAERKPDLIITVDNGIVAHEAFQRLRDEGVDTILTDHHVPEQKLKDSRIADTRSKTQDISSGEFEYPPADIIIHSTKLCGATVAWMFARELNKEKASTLLDLCGIATIADQMILQGANRSFATFGIRSLRTSERIGIQNLCQIAGVEQNEITTRTINFALAPRINAMGRLGSALDALRALCTKDQQKSFDLMQKLQQTNSERQTLTWEMVEEAESQAEAWQDEHIIIVASEKYHDGVIGLIAGKLMEKFYKPAIAISIGEKFAKASARSVEGVNIVELIRKVRKDLLEVGGHPMAAGFGLLPEKVEQVKRKLLNLAKSEIDTALLQQSLTVECVLPISLVNVGLLEMLDTFDPFGNGNPEPMFGLREVTIKSCYAVGKEKKHLKLVISYQLLDTSYELDGIGFGLGELEKSLKQGDVVDIAGTLSINEWNGKKSVQMVVKDVVKG